LLTTCHPPHKGEGKEGTDCPTSKSLNPLSSPICKNIFLLVCPKSNP
jgi:hypothetical protein